MALDVRDSDHLRTSPTAGVVRCDICSHWIDGAVYFFGDSLVCRSCFSDLNANKEKLQEERLVPSIRYMVLSLLVGNAFAWAGADYPLVTWTSNAVVWGSLVGIAYQSWHYVTGRRG